MRAPDAGGPEQALNGLLYRARAMEKLGLANRAALVRYALARGWLEG